MKKILVFQHVPYEPLGTLNPLLKASGFRLRYINFGRDPKQHPSLQGYHGLVVLGGPMSANDENNYQHLHTEKILIEQAIKEQIPLLGICLGAQLIARVLGAKVSSCPQKEIGWHSLYATKAGQIDPLFSPIGKSRKIFQWHGDMFQTPSTAEKLAWSDLCENQAFRYGETTYGFQFHLEANAALIQRWLRLAAYRKELAQLSGETDATSILQQTRENIDSQQRVAHQVFSKFVDLFGAIRQSHSHLPSR